MAMLKCPECGEYVSEFARACPNCGCPMSDIAQENQVDDRNWDPNQTKRKTNTQVYSQEELNRALEEARAGQSRQQRKPGQERVVKNSESKFRLKIKGKKAVQRKELESSYYSDRDSGSDCGRADLLFRYGFIGQAEGQSGK